MKEKSGSLFFKILAAFEAFIIVIMTCFIVWYMFIRDEDITAERAVPAMAELPEDSEEIPEELPEEQDIRKRVIIEKEETMYQLDGKKILLDDGTYGQVFMPVFADVPASELQNDNFVSRNGYSFYKENGSIISKTGIDVSEYQGNINWNKVKTAGIDFAIIRIGYRTYGGGAVEMDTLYAENLRAAQEAGVNTGAYFFSQAVTADEAIEEADAVIDAIKPYNITYPVVFDWELITGDNARTDKISVETLADCCIAFCERVKSAGYKPMIYQNKNTSLRKLDLPRLKEYDFWLAEYDEKPSYYYDYKIWQYASDAVVPGIAGETDINLCFCDYSQ